MHLHHVNLINAIRKKLQILTGNYLHVGTKNDYGCSLVYLYVCWLYNVFVQQ